MRGRYVERRCVEGRYVEGICVASAHRFNYNGFHDRHFKWHGLERGSSRARKRLGEREEERVRGREREILMDKIISLQINCFFFLELDSSDIFRHLGQRESEEILKLTHEDITTAEFLIFICEPTLGENL